MKISVFSILSFLTIFFSNTAFAAKECSNLEHIVHGIATTDDGCYEGCIQLTKTCLAYKCICYSKAQGMCVLNVRKLYRVQHAACDERISTAYKGYQVKNVLKLLGAISAHKEDRPEFEIKTDFEDEFIQVVSKDLLRYDTIKEVDGLDMNQVTNPEVAPTAAEESIEETDQNISLDKSEITTSVNEIVKFEDADLNIAKENEEEEEEESEQLLTAIDTEVWNVNLGTEDTTLEDIQDANLNVQYDEDLIDSDQ